MTARERRRELLELLSLRRHDTRENLAFEFGVSKRTIEYDVEKLSQEYPIYTTLGRGGGIYLMDGFRLNRSLSNKQVALLQRLSSNLVGEDKELMKSILKKFGKGEEE